MSIADGLQHQPNTLLIGISPAGGVLPKSWDLFIREGLAAGLDVVSGLHDFLGDNREYRELAARRGGAIWDLRRPPGTLELPPPDWQKRDACSPSAPTATPEK